MFLTPCERGLRHAITSAKIAFRYLLSLTTDRILDQATPENNGVEGGRGNRTNNVRTKLEDNILSNVISAKAACGSGSSETDCASGTGTALLGFLEKPGLLRFRNEISLTVRFENDFGESEWFAIGDFDVNQRPAPSDAYLMPSCLFAIIAGERPLTDSRTRNNPANNFSGEKEPP
jgi:hypothetical protein